MRKSARVGISVDSIRISAAEESVREGRLDQALTFLGSVSKEGRKGLRYDSVRARIQHSTVTALHSMVEKAGTSEPYRSDNRSLLESREYAPKAFGVSSWNVC